MSLVKLPKRPSKEEINKKAQQIGTIKKGNDIIANITNAIQLIRDAFSFKTEKCLVLDNEKDLNNYIENAIQDGVVCIDTETTGLNDIDDKIVGISLKSNFQVEAYIPINHVSSYSKQRLPDQLTEEQVRPYIQKLVDSTWTVWANAAFDIGFLYWQVGVITPSDTLLWDVLIAGHILNENDDIGLKQLYRKYIKTEDDIMEKYSFSSLFGSTGIASIPIDVAALYASHDVVMTESLFNFQYPYLNTNNIENNTQYAGISYVYNYIDLPSTAVVIELRNNGLTVDKQYADELSKKYTKLLEEAQKEYYDELSKYEQDILGFYKVKGIKDSTKINYASPKQLSIFLYDILKIQPVDKENPRGTGEDILKKIDLPICKAILKCREIEKLLGTYIDKFGKIINEKTGKIHARFNIIGTVTGRYSSSDPNLQNIPSQNQDIRKMVIPDDGYVLVGSDYSQQEPRILAFMSGDEHLQQAYKQGKDLYSWAASLVYNIPYEQCLEKLPDGTVNKKGKQVRDKLKAVVLAIIYGKAPETVAVDLNISKQEAYDVYEKFFETFPKVREFINNSQRHAMEYGFVETVWGRKRRLPNMQLPLYEFSLVENAVVNFDPLFFGEQKKMELTKQVMDKYSNLLDKAKSYKGKQDIIDQAQREGIIIRLNDKKISDAERQCVNSRIQGSAADMIKLACINILNNDEMNKLGFRLLMTVHDEIIGQAPISNAKRAGELLSEIMIKTSLERISVPMKCDVEITNRWTGEKLKV